MRSYEAFDELDLLPYGEASSDGKSIRNHLIDTYVPILEKMGLELSTPTDLGRDDRGRRLTPDPERALPLAVTVNDASKFLHTLDSLENNDGQPADTDTRDRNLFVDGVCKGTARVIRGGYDSQDDRAVAHAERLLLTMSEVVPILKEKDYEQTPFLRGRGDNLTTCEEYIERYEDGTLEDYLGAEKRDIVTQEKHTYGPSNWGTDIMFEPLHNPSELSDKWHEALKYMKELQTKKSPLFDELFPNLRNDFESSLSWFNEKPQQTSEEKEKATILKELESVWSSDFVEAGGIYQLDKAVEATRLAQDALSYGLKGDEIPDLSPGADEIAVMAARGLIREQTQHILRIGETLPKPVTDSQYAIRKDEDNMRHILNYLDEGHVRYRKDKLRSILGTPQFQLELGVSPDGQNLIIEKKISRLADNVNEGIRLQAIIDDHGIRARLRNEHVGGVTHYNHWLTPAESIQVATAMITQLEKESAPFAR